MQKTSLPVHELSSGPVSCPTCSFPNCSCESPPPSLQAHLETAQKMVSRQVEDLLCDSNARRRRQRVGKVGTAFLWWPKKLHSSTANSHVHASQQLLAAQQCSQASQSAMQPNAEVVSYARNEFQVFAVHTSFFRIYASDV